MKKQRLEAQALRSGYEKLWSRKAGLVRKVSYAIGEVITCEELGSRDTGIVAVYSAVIWKPDGSEKVGAVLLQRYSGAHNGYVQVVLDFPNGTTQFVEEVKQLQEQYTEVAKLWTPPNPGVKLYTPVEVEFRMPGGLRVGFLRQPHREVGFIELQDEKGCGRTEEVLRMLDGLIERVGEACAELEARLGVDRISPASTPVAPGV